MDPKEEAMRHQLADWLRNLAGRLENGELLDVEFSHNTPVTEYSHPSEMGIHCVQLGNQSVTISFTDPQAKERGVKQMAEHEAAMNKQLGGLPLGLEIIGK